MVKVSKYWVSLNHLAHDTPISRTISGRKNKESSQKMKKTHRTNHTAGNHFSIKSLREVEIPLDVRRFGKGRGVKQRDPDRIIIRVPLWLRGKDLNQQPLGYEPKNNTPILLGCNQVILATKLSYECWHKTCSSVFQRVREALRRLLCFFIQFRSIYSSAILRAFTIARWTAGAEMPRDSEISRSV